MKDYLDTIETAAVLHHPQLEMPADADQILKLYRGSNPAIGTAGLCYAAPAYAERLRQGLRQGDLPYRPGFHLTLVEAINTASRSAARNDYDFILMAGPEETQLADILKVAKAQFFRGKNSPVYILGPLDRKTSSLLALCGPKYGLHNPPVVGDIAELLR